VTWSHCSRCSPGVFTDAAGVAQWLPVVERFLQRYGIPFAPATAAAKSA
jgi:hypothetical protein